MLGLGHWISRDLATLCAGRCKFTVVTHAARGDQVLPVRAVHFKSGTHEEAVEAVTKPDC